MLLLMLLLLLLCLLLSLTLCCLLLPPSAGLREVSIVEALVHMPLRLAIAALGLSGIKGQYTSRSKLLEDTLERGDNPSLRDLHPDLKQLVLGSRVCLNLEALCTR